MILTRHPTPAGPAYAALGPDGAAREIAGDIFGEFHLTDRVVRPTRLLAPIVPADILCIGANYRKHIEESGPGAPTRPVLFMKSRGALQDPLRPIEIPVTLASSEVDYEGELAVVIGRRCKNVTRARALEFVLGYTCANDVSARDWQHPRLGGGQWCAGKGFDTFCPLGPVLVTRDEIPNPNALRVRTLVNGEVRQDASTREMIADVPALIEFLSSSRTLLPGTVILTGTPHGVGAARNPPVFLQAGDTVTVEIERIGRLTNPVVREGAGPTTGDDAQTSGINS